MRVYIRKLTPYRLFTKIFIVMVVSMIIVTILTSWTTIRMSERLFMNTFSITNSKVIEQIKASFASFNYSIVTASSNVQLSGTIKQFLVGNETDSLTMIKEYYVMGEQMKQIQSNIDAYEVGVTVLGHNGRRYATNRLQWSNSLAVMQQHDLTMNAQANPDRLLYQYYPEQGEDNLQATPIIVATKVLMDRTNRMPYGVVYFSIREHDFKQFYANYTSIGNDVMLVNQLGTVMSSNREELIGQTVNELVAHAVSMREHNVDYINTTVMGKDSIVLADYLPTYDFYIINLIDRDIAIGQIIDFPIVVMISIGIVMLASMIMFLISQRMTKSLTKLVKQMSNITKRDFHNYIMIDGSYETRELGAAFNYMLDELHEYTNKLVETERAKRNADLAALQSQINPHFLYNTFASIKVLVQQGSKERAAATINALISLLHNTISNVSETITIEEELINLKNYVFINHIRYGEQIKVNYFVAPDCMQFHVPKLIIQPFIENGFFHAFNQKKEGYIHVLVSIERNALVCEIVDNGDGIPSDIAAEIAGAQDQHISLGSSISRQLFSGIGINNVNDRIALLYGPDFGLSITSQPQEGTRVKIKLPLLERDKNSTNRVKYIPNDDEFELDKMCT